MFRTLFAFAILALSTATADAADSDGNARPVLSVYSVTVKPSGMAALTEMGKQVVAANRQLETDRYWTAWRQMAGTNNELMFIRSFPNFAALDEAPVDAVTTAYGPEKAAEIYQAWGAVETVQTGIWVHNPALSVGKPASNPGGVSIWLQVDVAAGEDEAFADYLAKVAEATREVTPDLSYQAYAPVAGEPGYWVFAIDTTLAQMDQGPGMSIMDRLQKAFGTSTARKLKAIRDKAVVDARQVIARVDPALSYWPEESVAGR